MIGLLGAELAPTRGVNMVTTADFEKIDRRQSLLPANEVDIKQPSLA